MPSALSLLIRLIGRVEPDPQPRAFEGGAALGGSNPLAPIPQLAAKVEHLEFKRFNSVEDLQRDRQVARFRDPEGPKVLICTEVGGEARCELHVADILERRELTGVHRFQVRVFDGRRFVIRHRPATDCWELAAVYGPAPRHAWHALMRRSR